MTLVDSLDSILMLYAYADVDIRQPGAWNVFELKSGLPSRADFDEGVLSASDARQPSNLNGGSGEKDPETMVADTLPSLTRAADTHQQSLTGADADVTSPDEPKYDIKKLEHDDLERAPSAPRLAREGVNNTVILNTNVGGSTVPASTAAQRTINKRRTMSNLSIVLTFMSVLVAFRYVI
jgi:hypothetical protein